MAYCQMKSESINLLSSYSTDSFKRARGHFHANVQNSPFSLIFHTLGDSLCIGTVSTKKGPKMEDFFIFLCRNYFLPRFACFSFLISWYKFSFPTVNLQYEVRKSEIMEGFQNHIKGKKRQKIKSAHKIK